MTKDQRIPRTRRFLNADYLIKVLRRRLNDVPDQRREPSVTYPMVDTLMSAFAMFSLKEPSLLSFQERDDEPAIRHMFGIKSIPSDSTMREILDGIDIEPLNQAFADIFHELQRSGELKRWVFDRGHYLMAIDGTGHFSSTKICCDHCLVKKHSNGTIEYYHQAVAAVLTHPETGEVLPIAVEPIIKQDGQTKNDCERNATKRLLKRVRALHPKLKLIVVEDGLASNAPHIADLKDAHMHFLLGAKPGDHAYLFEQVIEAGDRGEGETVRVASASAEKIVKSETQVINNLALNKSNEDVRVNFLQHHEYDEESGAVSTRFSWISDMEIDRPRILLYQRGSRSRWRVENETFNTLKNQGYHYEHNYGHGRENLSTVLMLLMFLAFYIDQVQQACCPLFRAALDKLKTRRKLWDHLRSHVRHFNFRSFADLWATILTGAAKSQHPPPHYA